MSIWSINGKSGLRDERQERIAAGTVGGDHAVPSSFTGRGTSSIITVMDSPVLYYGGTWSLGFLQDVNEFMGYRARNNTADAYLTVQFYGTSISIIGNNGPDFGRFNVYIDGVLTSGSVNTFTPLDVNYYTGGGLDASSTTIALTDASNFASSGTITIDGEDITYSGKSTNNLTGCTRGANGTTATTHRSGSMVYQNNSLVEGYAPYRQNRIILWRKTNLPQGAHTLKVVLRSDKDASSTNYYTEIGGFLVGGMIGSQNITTNLRYITYSGTTDGNGVLGPITLTPSTTNEQLLAVIGAYPTATANTASVMFNPTNGKYYVVTNKLSTGGVGVVLTCLYLGPTL